jgi:flagellar motor switch protein FliG
MANENPLDLADMDGAQRAAVLLLLLGEKHGQPIWAMLEQDEVKKVSYAMAQLGSINPKVVEKLIVEFISRLSAGGAVTGSLDRTEELLAKIFPGEEVSSIMSEIKGASGRRMWQRLSHIEPEILANYLRSEYPQTVAVILSRLRPDHTARVLSIFPDDFAVDVCNRMLRMETVQKEALEYIEETLRNEFVTTITQTSRRDAHELMAEVFNAFDRQTEARFLGALDETNRGDGAGRAIGRPDRALGGERADHGRERHRQGGARALPPPALDAQGEALRVGELRRDPRQSPRIRALRP